MEKADLGIRLALTKSWRSRERGTRREEGSQEGRKTTEGVEDRLKGRINIQVEVGRTNPERREYRSLGGEGGEKGPGGSLEAKGLEDRPWCRR